MIVRPRPHWLRLLFVRRGSILGQILPQWLFIIGLSVLVVAGRGWLATHQLNLTATPFSLMGVALAIFLGFRINASYDRYWEARKLWGQVLIDGRNLARKLLTCCEPGPRQRGLVLAIAAFAATMRNQLRGQPWHQGTEGLLSFELRQNLSGMENCPQAILLWIGRQLAQLRRRGDLAPMLAPTLEDSLDKLSLAWGGCERIGATPLPFSYTVILHRSAYLYCILLPLGLVQTVGAMTPLVVAFVAYTFFTLEAFSHEIEDPFGRAANDLPLDALVTGIEASLKQMLGETGPQAALPDEAFVLR
ncbi:MAG: bestrophin family protein [Zoogloea sp.]|uniref:bestrophin family protein n=1 Tax=Zoogloea sp. TaxID=49181 RepID=UPI003F2E4826